jgi:hypothetical protein
MPKNLIVKHIITIPTQLILSVTITVALQIKQRTLVPGLFSLKKRGFLLSLPTQFQANERFQFQTPK